MWVSTGLFLEHLQFTCAFNCRVKGWIGKENSGEMSASWQLA